MENKTIFAFLFFFVVLIFSTSCAVKNNHYYVPPEGNVLTLSERNDVKISGTLSLHKNGIKNLQVGYSPINHLGIIGSWMSQKNGKGYYPFDVVNYQNDNTANYKSLAIGGYFFKKRNTYYSTIIPKKYFAQGGFLADVYFGIGKGNLFREYKTVRSYFDFDYQKIYGQIGLHYKFRTFGVSGFLKMGQMNVKRILVHANFFLFPKGFFDELKVNNNINTFESGLRFEYGIRQAKFNLNITFFSDEFQDGPKFTTPSRSYYSVGVLLNVNEFFKKKKKGKDKK